MMNWKKKQARKKKQKPCSPHNRQSAITGITTDLTGTIQLSVLRSINRPKHNEQRINTIMNFLRKITGASPKEKKENWREKLAASSPRINQLEEPENHPMRLYVMSVDSLNGKGIDQRMIEGWSDKPPLFQDQKNPDSLRTLKAMCRGGIPPALRSAVWITSIVRVARPYQTKQETDEFGTLAKVKILDHGWEYVLKNMFPDTSDLEAAAIPNFGNDPKEVEALLIRDHMAATENDSEKVQKGVKQLTLVLYAVKENLGIEYCPLLPDLCAYLLSVMPVSYAYTCLREMTNAGDHYFPMSKVEHLSWCKTFANLMRKMYPQTALMMSRRLVSDWLCQGFRFTSCVFISKQNSYHTAGR